VSGAVRGVLLAALLLPGGTWACSGPGAAAAVRRAEVGGWGLAALTAVLVMAATGFARSRSVGRGPVAAGWVLVGVHPGLWLDAGGGDCGSARLEGSILFTAVACVIALWSAWRPADAG